MIFKRLFEYFWHKPNKRTAYISGPMTGHRMKNVELFVQGEKLLRAKGYDVVNPATKPGEDLKAHDTPPKWLNYILIDLPMVSQCKEIWFISKRDPRLKRLTKDILNIFGGSFGSVIEYFVALKFGLGVSHFNQGDLYGSKRSKARSGKAKV